MVDYNNQALDAAKKQITELAPGTKILTVTADVSKEEQVKAYVDAGVKEFGKIDGLYNNAGIEGKQASLTEYDVDVFNA